MVDKLHEFPFWLLVFDKRGAVEEPGGIDRLIAELGAQQITDLFIFSHGWNNDRTVALDLYNRFFAEVRKVLDTQAAKSDKRIGIVGIIWPSILWPDDAESASMNHVMTGSGGAAAFRGGAPVPAAKATPKQILDELSKGYDDRQLPLLKELTDMLQTPPKTHEALQAFRSKLGELLDSEGDTSLDRRQPDSAEGAIATLSDQKWHQLLEVLGDQALRDQSSSGGAAGLADSFKKLWAGAKQALRIATYWQMKERSGVIGRTGLGEQVLSRIAVEAAQLRVHLLGHSFGARLVSFSLAGLPAALEGERSPVKSLLLLQGAFSHFAFADQLPHDRARSGALKGMAARVDGPLLATYSQEDLSVGRAYPVASFVNGEDAEALQDQVSRWAGMGYDGAQAVGAAVANLSPPSFQYSFEKSKWLNLDGNKVIVHGGLPSGAHGDIVHPHTAWAALAAAGIV